MIQIKVLMGTSNNGEHEEYLGVSSLDTAEDEVNKLLERFNREEKERYGPVAPVRKLIRIIGGTGENIHEWEKNNLFTRKSSKGLYDEWKCNICGIKEKAYGLCRPIGGGCFPERTCILCNKVFKSGKNKIKHMVGVHNVIKEG